MDTIDKRLLTLYSFTTFAAPIKKEQMSTLLVLNTRMSWIDSQLTIDSLLSDGLLGLTKNKIEITPKGLEVVEIYESKIPINIREDINEYINQHRAQLLGETISLSNFKSKGKNYIVNLELIENSQTLVKISLLVPNRQFAEQICNSWKESPQTIYRSLLQNFSNYLS